jgi:hypothetical protein
VSADRANASAKEVPVLIDTLTDTAIAAYVFTSSKHVNSLPFIAAVFHRKNAQ